MLERLGNIFLGLGVLTTAGLLLITILIVLSAALSGALNEAALGFLLLTPMSLTPLAIGAALRYVLAG